MRMSFYHVGPYRVSAHLLYGRRRRDATAAGRRRRTAERLPARQKRRARLEAADVGHRGDLRARYLPTAGLAPELAHRLGGVAERSVQAPAGQLSAPGVEREFTAEGDARAPVDERAGLAGPAKAHGLEPPDGFDGEAVVELGHVDVAGAQVGPRPHRFGGTVAHA